MSDTDTSPLAEMRQMIATARVQFLRDALPLAGTDDYLLGLVRSLAAAIGEVSPDEAMVALIRERDARNVPVTHALGRDAHAAAREHADKIAKG